MLQPSYNHTSNFNEYSICFLGYSCKHSSLALNVLSFELIYQVYIFHLEQPLLNLLYYVLSRIKIASIHPHNHALHIILVYFRQEYESKLYMQY